MQILEHILKNSKEEILATSWQPVGNLCEIGKQSATSWQPVGNPCEIGKLLANSSQSQLALRNSLAPLHCTFANFASHIKLQKLSEISHCQIRKPHCQIRNLAKFAKALRNSLRLRTHCEVFAKFSIFAHCFALRFCFAHNFSIRTPF